MAARPTLILSAAHPRTPFGGQSTDSWTGGSRWARSIPARPRRGCRQPVRQPWLAAAPMFHKSVGCMRATTLGEADVDAGGWCARDARGRCRVHLGDHGTPCSALGRVLSLGRGQVPVLRPRVALEGSEALGGRGDVPVVAATNPSSSAPSTGIEPPWPHHLQLFLVTGTGCLGACYLLRLEISPESALTAAFKDSLASVRRFAASRTNSSDGAGARRSK